MQRVDPARLAAALEALRAQLGERVTTGESARAHHGRDESWHPPCPPDAVCFAESTDDVVRAVRICAAQRVPIIPYGAGTSIEGQLIAEAGGISLDLSRMNRVLEVHPEDLDVRVQAGVTRKQLNDWLRSSGLFFPIDPGADATLGGMVATRASGTNAVRYGTMRDNVLGLEVVLADGRVVRTARRARKSSAGYDLTRLFVGSEGTLGVITEVTLRLYGLPEATSAAVVPFPDIGTAVDSVIETIQSGVPVARIELLDALQIRAVNAYSHLDYTETPTLFLEFHGTPAAVAEQAQTVAEIADGHGAGEFRWATEAEDRNRLWQARHQAYYAALSLRPGAKGWPTDVCVPISRLTECIVETHRDLAQSFLLAPMVGHVGDGNFHVLLLVDPERPEELAEAQRLNDRMIERALRLDGTCSGEHGVGLGKRRYLRAEHGEAVDVMWAIKRALDPHNLMNPGKVLEDAPSGAAEAEPRGW
jgi:D-lactate dehydrogenase (cytochrome)